MTVAELRSFSRAAEALLISQPAVSKGVRELETQLDLALIDRGPLSNHATKGLRLTEAGGALLSHARGLFAMERVAIEEVRARVGLLRGTLTVGSSTTVAGYWIPKYMARFAERYPSIGLRLVVGNTQWVSEQLVGCYIDLALVEGPVMDPRIASCYWHDEPLCIVASLHSCLPETELTIEALSTQLWVLRESGSGTGDAVRRIIREHGIQVNNCIEIASNEAIARVVADGAGISILPRVVVDDLAALKRIKLLSLADVAAFLRPLSLLELHNRPLSPAAQAFKRLLLEDRDSKPASRSNSA